MTKQELIDHLKHLEQYTHYSEDAPALREAIRILTEMEQTEDDRKIDAIDKALSRTFTEPCGEMILKDVPSAQPEIVMCKDCKHNPKDTWFECPMAHCSETQRPETAWCWKGERREDGQNA